MCQIVVVEELDGIAELIAHVPDVIQWVRLVIIVSLLEIGNIALHVLKISCKVDGAASSKEMTILRAT